MRLRGHGSTSSSSGGARSLPSIRKVDGKTGDQLGSMGGGNHFIEVCLDEEDRVWVMLHSGSRGTGNRIGAYFINVAKEAIAKERLDFHLADKDLAFLARRLSSCSMITSRR